MTVRVLRAMSSEKSLSEILVKDIMTKALISIDPGTTVFQVAKMMEQGGIGAVFVKKDDTTSVLSINLIGNLFHLAR